MVMSSVVLSLFDLNLHLSTNLNEENFSIHDVLNGIRKNVGVLPFSHFDRFSNKFSHIFSSSFAAGYYSYLYSEMLANDIFTIFEDNGLFYQKAGERFVSTILEQGYSKNPMDLLYDFMH